MPRLLSRFCVHRFQRETLAYSRFLTFGPSALSNAFHEIAQVMRAEGEVSKDIRLGDLRGTIETLLAAHGISMEVRAQLQSHGLGGVQNRHYDRHSYMDEKFKALSVLEQLLENMPGDGVIVLRQIQ